jgi:hypothetical protein
VEKQDRQNCSLTENPLLAGVSGVSCTTKQEINRMKVGLLSTDPKTAPRISVLASFLYIGFHRSLGLVHQGTMFALTL